MPSTILALKKIEGKKLSSRQYIRPHTVSNINLPTDYHNPEKIKRRRPKTASELEKTKFNRVEYDLDFRLPTDKMALEDCLFENVVELTNGNAINSYDNSNNSSLSDYLRKRAKELPLIDNSYILTKSASAMGLQQKAEGIYFYYKYANLASCDTKMPLYLIGQQRIVKRAIKAWEQENVPEPVPVFSAVRIDPDLRAKWQKVMEDVRNYQHDEVIGSQAPLEAGFDQGGVSLSDGTGAAVYKHQCKLDKIIPISYFVKRLKESSIVMRHHYLSQQSVRSICIALMHNTISETIDFTDNHIDRVGAMWFARLLKVNAFITDLDLSDNIIKCAGVQILCKMLHGNESLQHLTLRGNQLTDRALISLVEALKENSTLLTLDISNNDFSGEGAIALGTLIAVARFLHTLDLKWCGIRQKGGSAILNALAKNERLQVLDLSWNGVTIDFPLTRILKVNTSLKVLDLSHNNITTTGALNLAVGLKKNSSLTTVMLAHNSIQETGIARILKSINNHPTIQLLSVEEMPLTDTILVKCNGLLDKGIIILQSGLNNYRRHSPELSMSKLLHKLISLKRAEFYDNLTALDLDKHDWLDGESFGKAMGRTGIFLTNKLLHALIGELDPRLSNKIPYKDMFLEEPPTKCSFTIPLRHELYPLFYMVKRSEVHSSHSQPLSPPVTSNWKMSMDF